MPLLSVALASAAPTFLGEPDDVRLAQRAWAAARACTGREGRAEPVVPLVRKTIPLEYLGVARTDEHGTLWRIELDARPDRQREVVVHEVTHAWVSDGPVALVEGSAELLADCVVGRDPGLAPLQFDDGRVLSGLPDLVRWDKPSEDAPAGLHTVRTDAYVGAGRLLRTVAEIVPPERLWAAPSLSWEAVRGLLAEAGPRGLELLAALDGGAATQAAALADADRDGLTALQERWRGTDEGRFDAAAGEGDVVVPLDGTPVCAAGGRIGSNARGASLPEVRLERTTTGARLARLSEPPPTTTVGGWWVRDGAADQPACASDARVTVWAEEAALVGRVAEVAREVGAALAEVEERHGLGPERVAVVLGGAVTGVEGQVVRIATDDAQGDPALVARLAVAARRLWTDGQRDWSAVQAVAASLGRPSP